jgi:gas vesicle protein
MKISKLLVFAAIGVAAGLLLTTEKGAALREDLADAAGDWKEKLNKLARKSGSQLSDLRDLVSKEISGLSDDTRQRITDILDEGEGKAKNMRKKVSSEMA